MKTRIKSFLLGATGAMLISTSALAHDTEIYFAQANVDNPDNVPTANVLFLIDTSGSMCDPSVSGGSSWDRNRARCKEAGNPGVDRPMYALREAFEQMVGGLDEDVSIGLAKFNGGHDNSGYGGYVFYPVSAEQSKKNEMVELVKRLDGTSNTPTMEAYSEAARYMLGMSPSGYAKLGEAISNTPRPAVNMRQSTTSVWDNCATRNWWNQCQGGWVNKQVWESDNVYVTPINKKNQCESNHIIVMTDGAPTRDGDYSSVTNIAGGSCSGSTSNFFGSTDERRSFACQTHLAKWLFNEGEDHLVNGNLQRKSIKTWQIAFGVGTNSNEVKNMRQVAKAGGTDDVYYADDATSLGEALTSILDLVDSESRNISSPGVAVSAMNSFQHQDILLYSVFQPGESSYWEGNLKKYRYATLDPDGNEVKQLPDNTRIRVSDDGQKLEVVNKKGEVVKRNGKDFTLKQAILDANGNEAVDPDTGFFKPTAKSLWSNSNRTDGTDVTQGGAREQVSNRKLFYNDAGSTTTRQYNWGGSAPDNDFFGLADNTERERMNNELKVMWGDAMHGVPLVVSYGVEKDAAGKPKVDANGDFIENSYAFISTNGGMLHIINVDDGKEQAVFMPHETFQKAREFTIDRPALNDDNTRALYGLDGSWTVWRKMASDAKIGDKPEKVYIYGGMRRGGSSYYALDVTNPASPKLVWQIKAGSGDFAKLGQTWSTPTMIRVPGPNNTSIPALVFGGGYSPNDHDGKKQRTTGDAMGNAIYVVNAENGNLIWKADGTSNANMKWAVPSDISVVDLNLDGVADHFYFGDLGGQVFRVDVKGYNNYSLERIGNLSGGGESDSRRFFTAPDIGIFNNQLYVAIASGHHENPLDRDTSDGLFVLFDKSLGSTGSNAATLKLSDLTNVGTGSNVIGSNKGWYYLFKDDSGRWGEKAMSSPTIIDGKILLSTYSPEAAKDEDIQNACAVSYGAAYLHVVNLGTGAPEAMNKNLVDAPQQRSSVLPMTTPQASPAPMITAPGALGLPQPDGAPLNQPDFGFRKMRWDQLNETQADNIIDKATK